MFDSPDPPKIPTPPPVAAPESNLADLARQRRELERRRRGAGSLRIDPAVSTGAAAVPGFGVSIPTP